MTEKNPATSEVVWKIGGEAGNGIMTIGQIFARACTRAGLSVFDYQEFPSLIRGGHNVYQVRASAVPIHSQSAAVNCLVALNKETLDKHIAEVVSGGHVLYDGNEVHLEDAHIKRGVGMLAVPFLQIARDVAGERLMMNTVALGASARVVGMEFSLLQSVIHDTFRNKGAKVVDLDVRTARAGFEYMEKNFGATLVNKLPILKGQRQMIVSAVEAIAIGALRAGMKFYAAYPMTPSSGFLSFFAEVAEEYKLVVKQTEDEIAAINMAIGAGFAGVRAMTATSGGGFSLMTEALGLAGMTETPLVIVEGMRGGPSTGLPTWTEQGDLLFVRHASQGDFPRVVVAPGDMEECFAIIGQAFNLAEGYQLPVIILIDKFLADSHASIPILNSKTISIARGEYLDDRGITADAAVARYALTSTGVSPRIIPGISKAIFTASSDEHDECGDINEESDNRIKQMNKRMQKLHELSSQIPKPKLYGQAKADITLIAWGSTKGAVLDALEILEKQGVKANFLHLTYLHPFPTHHVLEVLKQAKHTMIIEGNYSGQLEAIIKQETLHTPDFRYRRYDGRPFYADDIAEQVRQALSHGYRT